MPPVFDDVPVLCGHRGSGRGTVAGHREGTLGSYRAAVEAGLPWVEVDARLTADGVLVVGHDPIADDRRFIAELTAAETDALGLMRVEDLLDELPPAVSVDVDVKTALEDALRTPADTTAGRVAELLAARRGTRRLLVTSFDPAAILLVRRRCPWLPIGLITWTRFPLRKAIPAAVHLGADVVAAHVGSFSLGDGAGPLPERDAATSVRVAHQAGLQVAVWCPPPREAQLLAAAGVDCLVVDDVPAAAGVMPRA